MTVTEHAEKTITSPQSWMLLPPGDGIRAFCRYAVPLPKPPEACCFDALAGIRRATHMELIAATRGSNFPWGSKLNPEPHEVSRLWREKYVGIGGLVHTHWFVTASGNRYCGAENVDQDGAGRLRSYLYLPGNLPSDSLDVNEGYALVKDVPEQNELLYRKVHQQVAKHIGTDEGGVILSPIEGKRTVYIGFTGKCQRCWNPETITLPQIQEHVPDYEFVMMDEWKNWTPK